MNLDSRIKLLTRLGAYMLSEEQDEQVARQKASVETPWFTPEFIQLACNNIARCFLDENKLSSWAHQYQLPNQPGTAKHVGIVMAGNIPLVGFHDFLSVFISGHRALVKTSTKDKTLMSFLIHKLHEWEPQTKALIREEERLNQADAYIATGSNNTSRYFEYYFGKYPHIIRKNRTSVAILGGNESAGDLENLADDIHLYFGRGCRNVTKLYVPPNYDFLPLLEASKKYAWFSDHHKYKNNYDYQLAIHILNNHYYMTNGFLLLKEDRSPFPPVSQVHYEFYEEKDKLAEALSGSPDIQCLVSPETTGFGRAQFPSLTDYADGIDTLAFLQSIGK